MPLIFERLILPSSKDGCSLGADGVEIVETVHYLDKNCLYSLRQFAFTLHLRVWYTLLSQRLQVRLLSRP